MYIKSNSERIYTFFTLVLVLRDFMEENNLPAIDYKFELQHHAKGLHKTLTKMMDSMIAKTGLTHDPAAIDQYVVASQIMEHLFSVGMKIESIEPEIRKQTLITQLNILLHSYNLPQLELLAAESTRTEDVESTTLTHD